MKDKHSAVSLIEHINNRSFELSNEKVQYEYRVIKQMCRNFVDKGEDE